MENNDKCCKNCSCASVTNTLYCNKIKRNVEPYELCLDYTERKQYSEGLEKLYNQFITR